MCSSFQETDKNSKLRGTKLAHVCKRKFVNDLNVTGLARPNKRLQINYYYYRCEVLIFKNFVNIFCSKSPKTIEEL